MSSKHTRGDWQASDNGRHVFEGTVGGCVAIAYSPSGDRAEAHANARLIAAAPDLLAAAKKAIPELRCLYEQVAKRSIETATNGSVRRAVDALAAAIAKAEGTNP